MLPVVVLALALGWWWLATQGAGSPAAAVPVVIPPVDAPEPDRLSVWEPVMLTDNQKAALQAIAAVSPNWDAADIMAFCQIESSFIATATRFEPALGESSYGLMQVLLSTARDRGFGGAPGDLFDPVENITVGCAQLDWIAAYLKTKMATVGLADVVAAYNAGVGNVLRGHIPVAYVGAWNAARARWQQALAQGVA